MAHDASTCMQLYLVRRGKMSCALTRWLSRVLAPCTHGMLCITHTHTHIFFTSGLCEQGDSHARLVKRRQRVAVLEHLSDNKTGERAPWELTRTYQFRAAFAMPTAHTVHQGRSAFYIASVHACIAVLEQEPNSICVACFAGVHEWRDAVAVLSVDVDAAFKQSLDARDVADTGTEVQRRTIGVGAYLQ